MTGRAFSHEHVRDQPCPITTECQSGECQISHSFTSCLVFFFYFLSFSLSLSLKWRRSLFSFVSIPPYLSWPLSLTAQVLAACPDGFSYRRSE